MARTASPARKINFPRRPDPRPPIVYSDNNSYGCIEGDFDLIPIDPDTILMLPSSYDSQSDLVFGPVHPLPILGLLNTLAEIHGPLYPS
ncbi:hypothetical protein CEP52_016075 [Fusarium oligoseptatum]|uniref:Uncharacterized protein n=1 Tax=Fusarium oligoseptatum TaxID=2604345 RepID=A0A428S766_9HYPO|nr:hypothetical protein CEP52_016075 [Fusarium oligoseptatum]